MQVCNKLKVSFLLSQSLQDAHGKKERVDLITEAVQIRQLRQGKTLVLGDVCIINKKEGFFFGTN